MKKIPPHIAWPLTIVGLLLLGIFWSFGVVMASFIDGGAQVVDNYYEKATRWDEQAALRQKGESLDVSIELKSVEDGPVPYFLEITIRDGYGEPVAGLAGEFKVLRPHRSEALDVQKLIPVEHASGLYRQPLPMASAGLWDFEIEAQLDSLHFIKTIRKELIL